MNCPKCGATECFRSPGEFRCGSGNCVDADDFDQSDICKELCELRSKLTPEGAESLKWTKNGTCFFAESAAGKLIIMPESWNNLFCLMLDGKTNTRQPTITAAKAHAEELHQASWREFKEKWGEEVKIKDLVWKKVFEGMYLARPILEGHAFVEQHDRIFWKYDFNGNTVTRFHSAKQAQDACNAEHKRLIAEWV